jgi:hypothetical protein
MQENNNTHVLTKQNRTETTPMHRRTFKMPFIQKQELPALCKPFPIHVQTNQKETNNEGRLGS